MNNKHVHIHLKYPSKALFSKFFFINFIKLVYRKSDIIVEFKCRHVNNYCSLRSYPQKIESERSLESYNINFTFSQTLPTNNMTFDFNSKPFVYSQTNEDYIVKGRMLYIAGRAPEVNKMNDGSTK